MTFKLSQIIAVFSLLIAMPLSLLYADSGEAYDVKAIDELIAQLGNDECMVRDNAQQELIASAAVAKPQLQAALNSTKDPEIYQRLQFILQSIPIVWEHPGDEPLVAEFIHLYKNKDMLAKMSLLESLHRLPIEAQLKILDRIFQNERDNGMAIYVAMTFWYWRPDVNSSQYAQIVQNAQNNWKNLDSPAAKSLWYLINYKTARTAATIWFDNQIKIYNVDINGDASKIIDIIPGFVGATLAELARREAESFLSSEDVPDGKKFNFPELKFGTSVGIVIVNGSVVTNQNVLLIRGRVLNAIYNVSKSSVILRPIIPLHGPLLALHRGMNKEAADWIKYEVTNPRNLDVRSHRRLADVLHDYGYDDMAVMVLEAATKDVPSVYKNDKGEMTAEDRVRLAYYRACQAKKENQLDKCWEFLQKACAEDPKEVDVDVLIAIWELCQVPADQNKIAAITDEKRQQVEKTINDHLAKLDNDIANSGFDSSHLLNEYAWLAAKTNRNLDKALKFAKEAVDTSPESAACTDTLAHAYAANGDIDNAIEIQNQAVKLDPASEQLYQNLQNFIKLKQSKE